MSALTKPRDTVQYSNETLPSLFTYTVKSATTIYQGSLVILTSGIAEPGNTASSGIVAVGRAEETVVNPSGGTLTVRVRQGCFKWTNNSSSIAGTDIGANCYIVDDQSVDISDGSVVDPPSAATRSTAGKIVKVDTDGVWVETKF